MKAVPLLLFVGILVFSSARKLDQEEVLNSLADDLRQALEKQIANDNAVATASARQLDREEFLNSLDEQEADAFAQALEEHINDNDVDAEQNDVAKLERERAVIAASADDDIHEVERRGWQCSCGYSW